MHENRSRLRGSEVIGMERAVVELSIEPAENANFCRAERLKPAVEEKVGAF